jgi:hypothetical protein
MSDFNADSLRPTPMIQPKTSGLAIASLVCGITAWTILPIFLNAIAAVITGSMAKKEIRESNGTISGSSMATAGLILGWVQIAFAVVAILVITVLAISAPSLVNIFNQVSSTLQP